MNNVANINKHTSMAAHSQEEMSPHFYEQHKIFKKCPLKKTGAEHVTASHAVFPQLHVSHNTEH